jgi:biotin-dependent carboxylase-like uncharacterized protein
MTLVTIHRGGPAISLQDLGRPGYMALGLSVGGAADPLALWEAAALLGLRTPDAAIEMAGAGGHFSSDQPMRFCLTGAPMQVLLDGAPVAWNTTHCLQPGQRLEVGGALAGNFGYLSFAGALMRPRVLGSHSAHLAAGIGAPLASGEVLELSPDAVPDAAALYLRVSDRFSGGEVRVMPGPQTNLFTPQTLGRFAQTQFTRGPQGNRQGVRFDHDVAAFFAAQSAGLVSDFISCGDVQVTGEGVPYVLLAECQTIGGYPRIGTVLPLDLPKVAQTPPGAPLRFRFVTLEEADALRLPPLKQLQGVLGQIRTLHRDPRDIADLLSYQLISGVTSGDDLERM